MLPAGSVISYQAKGSSGWFPDQGAVVNELNSEFSQNNITMRDFHWSMTPGTVVQSVDAYLGAPVTYQFTATLQTNSDFNAVQDVTSIADHALYIATGVFPASTAPGVTVPGSNPTATGQPSQATPDPNAPGGFDLSSILQGGVNSFALLMVGVILAVVLIIAGKNKGIV